MPKTHSPKFIIDYAFGGKPSIFRLFFASPLQLHLLFRSPHLHCGDVLGPLTPRRVSPLGGLRPAFPRSGAGLPGAGPPGQRGAGGPDVHLPAAGAGGVLVPGRLRGHAAAGGPLGLKETGRGEIPV